MKLDKLITSLRGQRAMSLQDVATASGNAFTRSFVHDIEHGRSADPRTSEIMGLAKAFRLKPEIIFAAAINSQETTNADTSPQV